MKQLSRFPGFVALQMTDQAPLGVFEFAEHGILAFELLDPILAERAQSRGIGLADALRLNRLAHGHQHDGMRIAPNTRRDAGDALADSANVVRYRHGLSVSFGFQFPGAKAR